MKTLKEYQLENYPACWKDCTDEENKEYNAKFVKEFGVVDLPENIAKIDCSADGFYRLRKRVPDSGLTQEERYEYLLLKSASNLNIIKNCLVFFTVLTAIGLAAWLIIALT